MRQYVTESLSPKKGKDHILYQWGTDNVVSHTIDRVRLPRSDDRLQSLSVLSGVMSSLYVFTFSEGVFVSLLEGQVPS